MGKKRAQSLIDSDSSDSDSDTNLESDLLSLANKRKKPGLTSKATSNSDSDSDWEQKNKSSAAPSSKKRKRTKKVSQSSSSSSEENWDDDDEPNENGDGNKGKAKNVASNAGLANSNSDQEEGEVSDSGSDDNGNKEKDNSVSTSSSSGGSSSSSSSSSDSEFDDGYDDDLMGDEEDRKRLNGLSEKERETEIFKRIEQRDIMRTRWEIERKLKLARRGERPEKSKSNESNKKKKQKSKQTKTKAKAKEIVTNVESPTLSTVTAPNDVNVSTAADVYSPVESPTPDPVSREQPTTSLTTGSSPEKSADDQGFSGSNVADYFDHKERSKERKKNVEMNRTDDKRSNAMAMLKAKREGKAKREEEEAKRQAERDREEEKEELESVSGCKSAVKLKASEIYSDDSGSSDWDEDEKPSGKRSRSSSSKASSESEDEEKTTKSPVFISTRDELNKLRLSRFKMERFVNLPSFENTIVNCFVRISIGNNGQKPVYRVAEIVGVVETAKIYLLGKTRTNRGLRLKHGTQERVFRLEFISNQDFTDSEFQKWRDICLQQNVLMPTIDLIEKKQKDIKNALNYEYKDEDVDKIVEEKNRFRNRPTNYAMRKTCLMKERDAAMLRGDYDIAQDLGHQIEELESRASELDKKRSSSISLISYINDRNRKRNVEDAEKAIMEEVRANKGMKVMDPFTRRITQPRMGFKTEKKDDEPVIQAPLPPPPPGKKRFNEATTSKAGDKDYSLYSLHDFDIDLDVALPVNTSNVLPKPVPKTSENVPKRSLNLEDYKKKRGLI